ncbi:MAG: hypothetical protein ISS19_05315 [Bacteroidales bacterium]|nr:hypothetical protein [Bacteroidales bacterium]
MKKLNRVIITMLTVLVSTYCLFGQETETSKTPEIGKFGIGLNFERNVSDNYYFFPVSTQFIFSYNIQSKIRIEPEISFEITNFYDDYDKVENKKKQLNVGIGGYGMVPRNSIIFIYGVRFNHLRYTNKSDNHTSGETATKAFSFGPVIGIDYLISSHLCIGADFKLLYLTELRQYDFNIADNVVEESTYKNFKSLAGLKFRFYF